MKKTTYKKMISKILICTMLSGASISLFAGCDFGNGENSSGSDNVNTYVVAKKHADENDKVYALTFDNAIGKNIMPVGAYAGPHSEDRVYKGQNLPSMVSEHYFDLYQEMGINFFTSTLNAKDAKIEEFLSLCDDYDMGAFITFDALNGPDVAPYVSTDTVESNLDLFANDHKSLLGFYLRDEPTKSMIDKLENTTNCLAESVYADTMYAYGNALPEYAGADFYWGAGSAENWETYLRAYCEQLQLQFLSFDFYPWYLSVDGSEVYNSGYIKALSVTRKVANDYKIPVWSCKQTGSIFETKDYPMSIQKILPNENKFRWQMSIDLAYGVKGFTYFLLCGDALGYDENIWEEGIDQYFGLFNAYTGEPNVWFDYAAEFDKHLTNIEGILMNSCHDGIIVNGAVIEKNNIGDEWIKSGSYYELESVSGSASLIGCYNYNGRTVLYVTNNSYSKNGTVTLNFSDNYGYTIFQKEQKFDESGKTLTLNLLPGEGTLVMLKYE